MVEIYGENVGDLTFLDEVIKIGDS